MTPEESEDDDWLLQQQRTLETGQKRSGSGINLGAAGLTQFVLHESLRRVRLPCGLPPYGPLLHRRACHRLPPPFALHEGFLDSLGETLYGEWLLQSGDVPKFTGRPRGAISTSEQEWQTTERSNFGYGVDSFAA